MRRRKNRRTESNTPTASWLLTYGDMVTLCLTFFVLLYSFSSLDTQKFKSLVISLQSALGANGANVSLINGYPGEKLSGEETLQVTLDKNQVQNYLKYEQETKELERIKKSLSSYLQEKGLSANITISIEERGLVLRFQDSILFEKSKADLVSSSVTVLAQVSEILQGVDNPIRIEGHTDDLPIHTPQFPSNWELSTSRATNVLRFMTNRGVDAQRLSAVGYGEFHPLNANDSEANRKKNRRVDIVLIRDSLRVNEPR